MIKLSVSIVLSAMLFLFWATIFASCAPLSSLEEKQCPCGDDAYACCKSTNLCVLTTESCPGETSTDTSNSTPTCSPDASCVVFVSQSSVAEKSLDGSSWERAWQTVQEGIDAAAPNNCEVWVAQGTYVPTVYSPYEGAEESPRGKSIVLRTGVALYGGFVGNENVCQRDPITNETVLSGDFSGDDGDEVNTGENAYQVLYGAENATLDGFIITGGNADQPAGSLFSMGGGLILHDIRMTLRNCTFIRNYANVGGAVALRKSNSGYDILFSTFIDNHAVWGGAVHNNISPAAKRIWNSVFENNTADEDGGAVYSDSGSFAEIISSLFFNNNAGRYGGAIRTYHATVTVINATITQNSAAIAGGIFNEATAVHIYNSIVYGNDFANSGEMYDQQFDAVVRNSLIPGFADSHTSNINGIPFFLDADAHDYRISELSGCINRGSNLYLPTDRMDLDGDSDVAEPISLDILGNRRIEDETVDIGAYEFAATK